MAGEAIRKNPEGEATTKSGLDGAGDEGEI
jgi:hypothetical protein